jgi:hypothetical protein
VGKEKGSGERKGIIGEKNNDLKRKLQENG